MVTTIQLPMELKLELDSLKTNPKMSYATLLKELVKKEKKRQEEFLLKEYGQKYGQEGIDETKEWEKTDKDWEY